MGSCRMVLLAALLISTVLVQGEVTSLSSACPDKWIDATFVDMGCLYFNSSAALTWDKTNSLCQMVANATLVEITTEMQMAFLQMELNVLADYEGARFWWTSGTDVGVNGKWVWAPSYTPVEEYIWADNKPSYHADYNCMMLNWNYQYLGYDYPCDFTEAYPICQKK